LFSQFEAAFLPQTSSARSAVRRVDRNRHQISIGWSLHLQLCRILLNPELKLVVSLAGRHGPHLASRRKLALPLPHHHINRLSLQSAPHSAIPWTLEFSPTPFHLLTFSPPTRPQHLSVGLNLHLVLGVEVSFVDGPQSKEGGSPKDSASSTDCATTNPTCPHL